MKIFLYILCGLQCLLWAAMNYEASAGLPCDFYYGYFILEGILLAAFIPLSVMGWRCWRFRRYLRQCLRLIDDERSWIAERAVDVIAEVFKKAAKELERMDVWDWNWRAQFRRELACAIVRWSDRPAIVASAEYSINCCLEYEEKENRRNASMVAHIKSERLKKLENDPILKT